VWSRLLTDVSTLETNNMLFPVKHQQVATAPGLPACALLSSAAASSLVHKHHVHDGEPHDQNAYEWSLCTEQ
jgi:hypothetical protein